MTLESVLVPTDGSDHALRAAEHGAALAEALDAALHVLTVVDLRTEAGPFNAGGLTEADEKRLREDAQRRIDRTLEVVDGPADVRTGILEGVPVEEIVGYADEHDGGVIAMGTQGRTGVERYLAGSVAEGVVRRARVPVLTVGATDWSHGAEPYEGVLVATDGSEHSMAAAEPALAMADVFDARVHAVYVVNVGAMASSAEYTAPTELLEQLESQGETATEEIATRARERGLDAVTHVGTGYPAEYLLEYAEDEGVDLIAMGTAGRTGVSRFLLGSTAERVIRHAEMPVLAVNTRDLDAE